MLVRERSQARRSSSLLPALPSSVNRGWECCVSERLEWEKRRREDMVRERGADPVWSEPFDPKDPDFQPPFMTSEQRAELTQYGLVADTRTSKERVARMPQAARRLGITLADVELADCLPAGLPRRLGLRRLRSQLLERHSFAAASYHRDTMENDRARAVIRNAVSALLAELNQRIREAFKWDESEDERLLSMLRAGCSWEVAAREFAQSEDQVKNRVVELGRQRSQNLDTHLPCSPDC